MRVYSRLVNSMRLPKRFTVAYKLYALCGIMAPQWLKKECVEEIMRAQSDGKDSHPTGRQFVAAVIALCLLFSCSDNAPAPPIGCASFKHEAGWTEYCLTKQVFLDSLARPGAQGNWQLCDTCK